VLLALLIPRAGTQKSLVPGKESKCSWTSLLQSTRSWKEGDGSTTFEVHLAIPEPWKPHAIVSVTWGDEPVIKETNGASLSSQSGATAEFELDGMKPHLQSIRIMGAGSLRMEPEVSCVEEESDGPGVPSPPAIDYCSMDPEYEVTRSWADACIIEISLGFWNDYREFKLSYFKSNVRTVEKSLVNVEMVSEDYSGGDSVITVKLVPKDYLHGGKFKFGMQLTPPASSKPRIECHNPWSPPPSPIPSPLPRPPPGPKPPPNPSPRPLPPPPRATKLAAASGCSLGGKMTVERAQTDDDGGGPIDMWRIVVRHAKWKEDWETKIRIKHEWNSELKVTDLAHATLEAQMLEPAADCTVLLFVPRRPSNPEERWFAFTANGAQLELATLNCR